MGRYDEPDGDGRKPQRPAASRSRSGRRSPLMLVSAWVAGVAVCALVVASLGFYLKERAVYDSIQRVSTKSLGKQPPKYSNAENIMLIGSDSRLGGKNAKIGGNVGCNCSDTVMLLHISPGHHLVTVVSVPRDTEVPIVSCEKVGGTQGQEAQVGVTEPINYTLSYGGPICTWRTLEKVTGIHIDHFVELNFTGFEHVINDIGGVNVCLPAAVDDSMSGLHLSAGRHHVYGSQALAFWRTREDLGMGTDTQRIQRDQFLMASLVQGIEQSGLLNSPSEILKVISDAAKAMTTDDTLDQSQMLTIANSLKGLASGNVQFVTAPNIPYPEDINKLELQQPQADNLFYALSHDTKLPSDKTPGKTGGTGTTPVLDTTPSKVNVQVLNGAGTSNLASVAGSDLTSQGFNVVGTGNADNFSYTNPVIEYSSGKDKAAVNTLKAQLSGVTVQKSPTALPAGTIELIVGSNFNGLGASSGQPHKKQKVNEISNTYGGITGNTKICKDKNAFTGPDGS
jgi:LCP family protein required for cell wall assembly